MMKLSDAYHACLLAATKHHAESKTYSGKLFRPHAKYVMELLQRLDAKSVLDYGCGKGLQYTWISDGGEGTVPKGMTIEQYWGVPVHKYDPAWPPFADDPRGKFDVVICTHTLGTIPVQDLNTIVARLMNFANRAVYIGEKIGRPNKKVYERVRVEMPHGWRRKHWVSLLKPHVRDDIELHLSTREWGENGAETIREIL